MTGTLFPQLTEPQAIAASLLQAPRDPDMPVILAAVTQRHPGLDAAELARAAEQVAHEWRRAQVTATFNTVTITDGAGNVIDLAARTPRVSGCCSAAVTVDFATGARTCDGCGAVLERPALDGCGFALEVPGPDEHALAAAAEGAPR